MFRTLIWRRPKYSKKFLKNLENLRFLGHSDRRTVGADSWFCWQRHRFNNPTKQESSYPAPHGVLVHRNNTLGHFRHSFMYFFVKPNDNLILRKHLMGPMIRFKRLFLLLTVIEKIRGVRNCLIILTMKGVFGQAEAEAWGSWGKHQRPHGAPRRNVYF